MENVLYRWKELLMESSHIHNSPLRYPGGKSKISSFMEDIILINNLDGCTLYELYAGGAGASLNMLFSGLCNRVVLNDLDYHIYAFWHSVLNRTEDFLRLIYDTEVNIENWDVQKRIYNHYQEFSLIEVGFSAFYLNRANRSGILYKAGPIGGRDQTGNYKIDARFNKLDLVKRIEKIARQKDEIEIHNLESLDFLKEIFSDNGEDKFIFLDPPYYVQGEHLYLSCYNDANHIALRDTLFNNKDESWFLTYDNSERINELYSMFRRSYLPMSYTLQNKRKSKEVMIFSENLHLPKQLRVGSNSINFNLIDSYV